MKLIIQIPCFNEEATLPGTLADLPREVEGIDRSSGSSSTTGRPTAPSRSRASTVWTTSSASRTTRAWRRPSRPGSTPPQLGADIIVNTDADNQYFGGDIPEAGAPILAGAPTW